jgi:hypothetical protein
MTMKKRDNAQMVLAAIAPQLKGGPLEKPAMAALNRSLDVLEQGII